MRRDGAHIRGKGQNSKLSKRTQRRPSAPVPRRPQRRRPGYISTPSLPETVSAEPSRIASPEVPEPQTVPPSICRKRSLDMRETVEDIPEGHGSKRPRASRPSIEPQHAALDDELDPVAYWAQEGRWPQRLKNVNPSLGHLYARTKSSSMASRKRSNTPLSLTPSDQRPREEKSTPYRNPRYKTLLATKGSFMEKSEFGITNESKILCRKLLDEVQEYPQDSLLGDNVFETTCSKIADKNESRVIQDISRLIVPSAESLATCGAKDLKILTESVNEGWNNSIPLTGTRPQPDYSVGFRREAFTDEQLHRIAPFVGDFLAGDQSFFMATYYMYFPFLTCEVKCGAAALNVADSQNAHGMTLAVRAIVELFRLVKRESELNRQILAFSISHDDRAVRIYGHYPVIDESPSGCEPPVSAAATNEPKYYRHPIREFSFAELEGHNKWAAYRFTKNVYDTWMPAHFKRICSAIDQLPDKLDFNVHSVPENRPSQELESHRLSRPDQDPLPVVARPPASASASAEAIASSEQASEPSQILTASTTAAPSTDALNKPRLTPTGYLKEKLDRRSQENERLMGLLEEQRQLSTEQLERHGQQRTEQLEKQRQMMEEKMERQRQDWERQKQEIMDLLKASMPVWGG